MTLALSMIVKNAAHDLERCIESARPLVDEIVVADTGSSDGTPGLAYRLGARVMLIPWEDDFALARNQALREVCSDWVLVLDADERLDPESASRLPSLLGNSSIAGYQVTIRNYTLSASDRIWDRPAVPNDFRLPEAKPYPAYVAHQNVRLFRRTPEIYFVGRVHESAGPRIIQTRGRLGKADFLIHHFGLVADAETRRRKNELYRELGRRKIREMPEDAQAHFELGLVEFDNFGDNEAALRCFEQACRLNPRLAVAWLFAALAQARLGRHDQVLASLARARRLGYDAPLLDETEGDALYNLGDFPAARRAYRTACRTLPGNGALESKLGLAELRAGQRAAGVQHLRQAISHAPQLAETYDRFIQAMVWLDRPAEAAEAAENKLTALDPAPTDFVRAASIRAHLGDQVKAIAILQSGIERFPCSEKIQQLLASLAVANLATSNAPRRSRPNKVLTGDADNPSGARSSVSRS